MKLIGSKTSPFVRRVRLQLADVPHEFEIVDLFAPADRPRVLATNPIGRIPILLDGDRTVWDSRLITRYLREKNGRPLPSLETELQLDLVDNATDTAVILFQLRRFKLDEKWENAFSRLQVDRLERLLGELDGKVPAAASGLEGIWLYSLLDWLLFREVTTLDRFAKLKAFHAAQAGNPAIRATDPRL